MVFIHGGGFQFGDGNIALEKYFMDEDVILVVINYRLGPFGTNTIDFLRMRCCNGIITITSKRICSHWTWCQFRDERSDSCPEMGSTKYPRVWRKSIISNHIRGKRRRHERVSFALIPLGQR